jgi:uncharacterized protein YueI
MVESASKPQLGARAVPAAAHHMLGTHRTLQRLTKAQALSLKKYQRMEIIQNTLNNHNAAYVRNLPLKQ